MNSMNDAHGQNWLDLPEFEEQAQLMDFPLPESPQHHAVTEPIARVLVDAPGSQWNPVYDYSVPASMDEQALIGCRVRVPYQHTRVEGFIIDRCAGSTYMPHIRAIESVISSFPALSNMTLELCTRIAQRQAAPLMHVIKTAVPARHARAEKAVNEMYQPSPEPHWHSCTPPDTGLWGYYTGGAELLEALTAGEIVRAGCSVAPAHRAADMLTAAVQAVFHNRKSAVLITATAREAFTLGDVCRRVFPHESIGVLTADSSHEERYRIFAGAVQGKVRLLIGTRSAAYVPVKNCGLVAIVDSLHSAHRDQRSPYTHSFDVLKERSDLEQCSFLALSRGPDLRMKVLENQGWAEPRIVLLPHRRRALSPQIILAQDIRYEGAEWARLPDAVFTMIRHGLEQGNVLVMTPQSGYIPLLSCARCFSRAYCLECHGSLNIPAPDMPAQCVRCGYTAREYTCPECGFHALRPRTFGSARTAQEIGRAFPGVSIILARRRQNHYQGEFGDKEYLEADNATQPHKPYSSAAQRFNESGGVKKKRRGAIVVATPADQLWYGEKFSCAVVLDAGFVLRSSGLASEEYMLRMAAKVAHYVTSRTESGSVLIVGDLPQEESNTNFFEHSFQKEDSAQSKQGSLVQTLRTLDWQDWEERAFAERSELHLPPAYTWIACEGEWGKLREFLSSIRGLDQKDRERAHYAQVGKESLQGEAILSQVSPSHNAPLDAFLSGGIHAITNIISLIGPTRQPDGTHVCYLRCLASERINMTRLVGRALRDLYSKRGTYLRVKVDPALQ